MNLSNAEAEEAVKLIRADERATAMHAAALNKDTEDTVAGMVAFVLGEPLDPERSIAWKFGWYRQADYMRSHPVKAVQPPPPDPPQSECVVDFSRAPGLVEALTKPVSTEPEEVYDPRERPTFKEAKPYCRYGHMRPSPRCKGCEQKRAQHKSVA